LISLMKNHLFFIALFAMGSVSTNAQVAPIQIGRASNVWTILRSEQNQVVADMATNTVAFIHRQDVTIWGGGTTANGRLRYDLSTNGGASFTNDIGVLNNAYTQPARYPQIIGFGSNANPFNNNFIWTAPTLTPTGDSDGFATGISQVTASNPVFSTETYNEVGNRTLLQGGLCEGLNGEFWQADFLALGGVVSDSIRLLKGTYNGITGSVAWEIYSRIYMDHYTGFDGTSRQLGPNMMFSPSGQDGWVGYLGDLNGGPDSTFNPIFIHSSNGGLTWGNPMEVDLSTVTFEAGGNTLVQELQALWEDSPGVPTSSGRATCSFEYDMTVDANGNPHLFVVVASASDNVNTPSYTVFGGLAKLAVDIFSEDGGVTWKAVKVAPIYAFRGEFGTPDPTNGSLLDMDNFPQISRTQDGSKIFYSWADSDTTVTGYGNRVNQAPNLRIAGRRLSDGFMTCPKWITLGDATWDGRMLFPTMAPEVMTSNAGTTYNLPIVSLDMLANDQSQPCQFWYWGGEATLDDADFFAPALSMISDNCSLNGVVRKPILEVYAGTWGDFDADIEVYADPLLATYPELSRITSHQSDALEIPDGQTVNNDLNNNGIPAGSVDRVLFGGESFVAVGRDQWTTRIAERLLNLAPVAVELENLSYNPVTRLLQVDVRGDFHSSVTGDLRFNLTLVEDSVTGYPQANGIFNTQAGHPYFGAGDPIVNFYHRNVIREHLGGAWGTAGIIPGSVANGSSYSTTYSYTIPAGMDENQVSIIGFVSEYGAGVDEREMLNSSGLVPLSTFLVPPVNDDVCNAIPLNFGVNGLFNATLATSEVGEPTPPIGTDLGGGGNAPGCESQDGWCGNNGEPVVTNTTWYTFVAPASGNVTLSTDGSTFDTQLAVWSATSCTALLSGGGTFVGGNDDNPNFITSQYSSEVTVTCLTPGETYYVQIDGWEGAEGEALITMTDNNYVADATISATSLVVCDGNDVTLSAPAGTGFTYAWFGAINNQTLSTSSAGQHWVMVTDSNSCTAADTVYLTIGETPIAGFTFLSNGLSVDFTDVFTGLLDAQTYTFGDGNTSNSSNPSHTYAVSGTYTVCNSVSNSCGNDVICQSVTVDITTGIDENNSMAVGLYPNPSEGSFTYEISGMYGVGSVSILDMMGRVVHTKSVVFSPEFRETLSLNLASGSYTLQVINSNSVITQRFQVK
jgi:PKD repeat protein